MRLDASSWAEVAIMASAVLVLAFVSGTTTAFAGLRRAHTQRLMSVDREVLHQLEARIASYRSALLILRSAAIIGIVSSSVLLAGDLSDRRWWAFVAAGIGCFFMLGLVELPVRALVSQDPVDVLRVAAVPLASIHVVLRPLVRLAPWSAEAAVAPDMTESGQGTGILEEVRQLQQLAVGPPVEDRLHEHEERMIRSIVGLKNTLVKEVMVPRPDVVALATDVTLQDAVATVLDSGHGRYPLFENSLDKIVGVIYARDMLRAGTERPATFNIRTLAREAYFVPETKRARDLLREFLTEKIKFAIVVDEYGGVEGVVGLQDLLEEIVG
ncbi:MAG: CBS domain-containing protein, partial [Chloroflexi bacterium]|nr:CBS domain-containing protein [Chloroflexota bacterium]